MKKFTTNKVADNPGYIKFIGLGESGKEIINNLNDINKEYLRLFPIEDIVSEKDNIYMMLQREKISIVVFDIQDKNIVNFMIDFGKVFSNDDNVIIPIIINSNVEDVDNKDCQFFIKQINKYIGSSINIPNKMWSSNNLNQTLDEIEIIRYIIDLLLDKVMIPCTTNIDLDDLKWMFKTKCNTQVSLFTIKPSNSIEEIRKQIMSNRICKKKMHLSKKILISANFSKDNIEYNDAFRIIQSIALAIYDISNEYSKIIFSMDFIDVSTDNIEILTIQV